MDDNKKKIKFTPKIQARKKRQSTAQKTEEDGKAAEAEAEQLLRRFNENTARQGDRAGKKPAVQVAFDQSAVSATPVQTYVVPQDRRSGPSSGISLKSPEPDDEDAVIAFDADGMLPSKMEKRYREPWADHSYYPTTLPLRMPHAGDPEILDEKEFGKLARNVEYDESTINSAVDLGLMTEGDNEELMLFQFPSILPMVTSSPSANGCKLEDLPEGFMGKLEDLPEGFLGKLVIYRSGAMKLRLGETLFDVSPGCEREFSEHAVAIDLKDKKYCVLGDTRKHFVAIPDVDSIFDSRDNLD